MATLSIGITFTEVSVDKSKHKSADLVLNNHSMLTLGGSNFLTAKKHHLNFVSKAWEF